jgi:hypothetical protein
MKKYIQLLAIFILVLLGACFIQGNFDVFGWEKKVRILTVSITIIVLLISSFIKEITKYDINDETDNETTI